MRIRMRLEMRTGMRTGVRTGMRTGVRTGMRTGVRIRMRLEMRTGMRTGMRVGTWGTTTQGLARKEECGCLGREMPDNKYGRSWDPGAPPRPAHSSGHWES